MKLVKKANGKTVLKLSEAEWQKIGRAQGWIALARKKHDISKCSQCSNRVSPGDLEDGVCSTCRGE